MGFRELFKVRRPGNGNAVQEAFKSASKRSQARKFEDNTSPNRMGGVKKSI